MNLVRCRFAGAKYQAMFSPPPSQYYQWAAAMGGSTGVLRQNARAGSVHRPRCVSLDRLAALLRATTIALMFVFSLGAQAERLPLRRYSVADGLASNQANCVVRDSYGFLWFCTPEGLSRFDGYTFVNYGVDDGLPDRVVSDFVETQSGEYWIATPRGLVRFNPKPAPSERRFVPYRLGENDAAQRVNALFADREGNVWVATYGVFRLTKVGNRWTSRRVDFPASDQSSEGPIMEDHDGNIWIVLGGDANTLWRVRPNGHVERFTDPFLLNNRIVSLFEDREGRIWAGSYHGLAVLADHPQPGQPFVGRVYGKKDGLLNEVAGRMFQSSDGRLWVGSGGLFEVFSDRDGRRSTFRLVGREQQGFGGIAAEDSQGNLWMGATRIARHGFVTYGQSDGLATEDIRSVFEGHDGELYVVTGTHGRFLHRFDGKRFVAVVPKVPGHDAAWDWEGWGWGQIHFQDHKGQWWVGTRHGLLRYPRVDRLEDLAHTPPLAIYTARHGLTAEDIFRLYEDSRGDIWIGAWSGHGLGLNRWERSTERFDVPNGWIAGEPTAFSEDRLGNLWIGSWGGDLSRYRHGQFTLFTGSDGLPEGTVFSILLDHAGRLWAGTTRGGLVRIDDPTAEQPRFVVYTTKQGLSSNDVRAITEDHWGRIYFWTGRGVDRLDPETGTVRRYTEADGLVPAGSDNNVAVCDRRGTLWFGFGGLARLDPMADAPNALPPPIRITGVRLRGVSYPVSELGETNLSGPVLNPEQDALAIDFASLNFGAGEVLRYQYKLEGADKDWSSLSELRTVNYAKLKPGAYRFVVRTVNSAGVISSSPASFTFRLLAPFWQRWWFLSLLALALGAIIYEVHRYRVAQLVAVERIRTRIASDLHDDVGAGLSQIAILSEVVKREVSPNGSKAAEVLDHMADLSRELVDSMGEIVWAISPRRDNFDALAQRMRRFASDVLAPRNIEFDFRVPSTEYDSTLGADVRRQVFLVFKEAINNSARHAGCTQVSATLVFERDNLKLTLSDNGCGLDAGGKQIEDHQGHGLESIRRRAGDIGGQIEIVSGQAGGTRIILRVPLARPRFFSSRPQNTYLNR